MNDHDAMDAINAVLDRVLRGELEQHDALMKIFYISGQNTIDHAEARP